MSIMSRIVQRSPCSANDASKIVDAIEAAKTVDGDAACRMAIRMLNAGFKPEDVEVVFRWIGGLAFATNNEAGVPVAKAVLVNAHRRGSLRQFTMPDDGGISCFVQPKPTAPDRETASRELQTWPRLLASLGLGATSTLHLERLVQRRGERVQHALLGVLRTVAKPCVLGACGGEQFAELSASRLATGLPLVNGFVPQPSAPTPLGFERCRSLHTWPKPVGVTQNFGRLIHSPTLLAKVLRLGPRRARTAKNELRGLPQVYLTSALLPIHASQGVC